MPRIFISHSWRDRDAVHQFKEKLASRGYQSLFIDYDPEHGIPAGSIWERELYRNLKVSGAVIVLCSPNSMGSRWCFAEITQARALGKKLFPVILAPCNVDRLLNDHQIVDLAAMGEDEGFRRPEDLPRAEREQAEVFERTHARESDALFEPKTRTDPLDRRTASQ